MKHRLIILVTTLLLSTLACQSIVQSGDQGDSTPSDLGQVLFQDDFSNSSSGWDRVNLEDGATDYANGIYRMFVSDSDTDIWANPGLNFTDVQIEVDATKIGGDDNNDFGIICRYTDTENFYFLIISSDGYYGIGKVIDGEQGLIGSESMPPSEVISKGNAENHLRADCVGNTLSLYVNGEQLASYDDPDLTSGDVGLIAGTFEVPGTEIHFDNFMVLKP